MLNCRGLLLMIFLATALCGAQGASARIKKVLPHYLDKQGRHTLAPSLFERDAYQAYLRRNRAERSALRFDVNWAAPGIASTNIVLRLELRGSKANLAKPLVLEAAVKPAVLFSKWTSLTLKSEDYESVGDLVAWRATLWNGDILLAEHKSFLW
jgi:hypothetical protein